MLTRDKRTCACLIKGIAVHFVSGVAHHAAMQGMHDEDTVGIQVLASRCLVVQLATMQLPCRFLNMLSVADASG